jgi:choline dehydrogenase
MYDYVIVGGGSAGCVLAARLSEDPDVTVCLIEAGPKDTDENIHMPLDSVKLFRTHQDWDYDTHVEPHCDDRRIYLPRGRVLGGSGSINGMIYIRGNRNDYDDWQQDGWSYADLLPYFKRSEDNERGATEFHGVGGPLAVTDSRSNNISAAAFAEAALEIGFPYNDDFNGAGQEGFGKYQITQRDGRRCSASTGFLHPALSRPNLTVETYLHVHRVLIENGRAVGVVGSRLDTLVEIRAETEVILSAGAYNSPQLLMLSGVGPADLLRSFDIPVVVDLPSVGWNLQDHPQTWLSFEHSQPTSLIAAAAPLHVKQYEDSRTGPMTSNGPETGGFVRTDASLRGPDLQFHCLPTLIADGCLTPPTTDAISFGSCVLAPRSRGHVTLASGQPTAKPKIQHNYYAEAADLETAIAGLRITLEISGTGAMKPYVENVYSAPESDAERDLRTFIRRNTQPIYHPSGTCAMGSVVDASLRVLGVDRLRVIDASIMPTVIRGNTNAPTMMIAEKGADLVKGQYSSRTW